LNWPAATAVSTMSFSAAWTFELPTARPITAAATAAKFAVSNFMFFAPYIHCDDEADMSDLTIETTKLIGLGSARWLRSNRAGT